jgi:hypothetical protein
VSRQIWATPAVTWSDIAARGELAKFWNRDGLGYQDHHGYDDAFADMRLIDDVLAVPVASAAVPVFVPPPALHAWRRLDADAKGVPDRGCQSLVFLGMFRSGSQLTLSCNSGSCQ